MQQGLWPNAAKKGKGGEKREGVADLQRGGWGRRKREDEDGGGGVDADLKRRGEGWGESEVKEREKRRSLGFLVEMRRQASVLALCTL
ncbi:hypothetical protein Sjap_015057 [Stephania japonica]|uniref:Uncharacterized protein n=1 Tax=Stephania japonica TaxID=461633 RepID=A0AAP0NSI0_9MAGN